MKAYDWDSSASDPAAQLVQRREAEALGVLYDDGQPRVGHIDAHFHHACRHQDLELAFRKEGEHGGPLLVLGQARMDDADGDASLKALPLSSSNMSCAFFKSSFSEASMSGYTKYACLPRVHLATHEIVDLLLVALGGHVRLDRQAAAGHGADGGKERPSPRTR